MHFWQFVFLNFCCTFFVYTLDIKWDGQCAKIYKLWIRRESYTNFKDTNSPTLCQQTCKNDGHPFAGLNNGRLCICYEDEAIATAEEKDSGECDKPCPGDSSVSCGAKYRCNIYSTKGNEA